MAREHSYAVDGPTAPVDGAPRACIAVVRAVVAVVRMTAEAKHAAYALAQGLAGRVAAMVRDVVRRRFTRSRLALEGAEVSTKVIANLSGELAYPTKTVARAVVPAGLPGHRLGTTRPMRGLHRGRPTGRGVMVVMVVVRRAPTRRSVLGGRGGSVVDITGAAAMMSAAVVAAGVVLVVGAQVLGIGVVRGRLAIAGCLVVLPGRAVVRGGVDDLGAV